MDVARQEARFGGGRLGGAAKCKKSCQSLNPMLGVDDLTLEYLVQARRSNSRQSTAASAAPSSVRSTPAGPALVLFDVPVLSR